jgi:hypothetical protein
MQSEKKVKNVPMLIKEKQNELETRFKQSYLTDNKSIRQYFLQMNREKNEMMESMKTKTSVKDEDKNNEDEN